MHELLLAPRALHPRGARIHLPQAIDRVACLPQAAWQLPRRMDRQSNRHAPADDREMSAVILRRTTPATATVSPVRPRADYYPRHTDSALQPNAGRSPMRGTVIRRSHHLRWHGLANRPIVSR